MHNDAINAYVFVNLMLFTKENNISDILSDDKCYSARQLLKEFHFYRAMRCIRGTSHGPVSVCSSVSVCVCLCPSVTSRSSTKTAKRRITQTTPHDTPRDSSFLVPKISAKFDRGHPLRGRQMQVGWVKIGNF